MHTFNAIAKSLGEVTLIAVLLGAGLPLIFAVGIRFWSLETATANGAPARNPLAQAVAYLCFAIVVIAVMIGILYIAKDFISHTFDIQLFGAKPPKK
ncbi:hypothetical protein OG874_06835 [Nocardia sp. NBC_00565]|uniref:hypothetical protein n=1 Tax=Nocardia sp. NBC_00565 TaxID=2975993 RepID=UPI002E8047AD|nr:hypothetical protein [Nocardia sp. NBC_00565]WUC04867.1 hypothetical protein OG874_06835 [Nocardia sp. NBC_00565]